MKGDSACGELSGRSVWKINHVYHKVFGQPFLLEQPWWDNTNTSSRHRGLSLGPRGPARVISSPSPHPAEGSSHWDFYHWVFLSEITPDRLYNQSCHFDNPAPANHDAGELLSLDRCVTAHEVTDQLVPCFITTRGFQLYTSLGLCTKALWIPPHHELRCHWNTREQRKQRYDGKNDDGLVQWHERIAWQSKYFFDGIKLKRKSLNFL